MKIKLFNPFQNKPWFLRVCRTSLLKTLREKEKLLVTSNFCFSHSVFYPFEKLSAIFIQFEILPTNSFSLEESIILLFGKRVKSAGAYFFQDVTINSSPNNKISDWSKRKTFGDDIKFD